MNALHVRILLPLFALCFGLEAASLNLSGVVSSENQKSIASRSMGFITEVHVSEGSRVKKNDLLYAIDSKESDTAKAQVELSIAQAALNVQMYENQYQNAVLNTQRYKRLLEKDMVSLYEVENLELSMQNLKAMVDIAKKQRAQAEQKLLELKNNYQYLQVRAPNDGVVIEKHIQAGEMAMPGVPALVLSDLNNLHLIVEVSERYLGILKMGEKADISLSSIGYKTEGKIVSIIPYSNALSHMFKVKLAFDGNAKVFPGMYAEVTFSGITP